MPPTAKNTAIMNKNNVTSSITARPLQLPCYKIISFILSRCWGEKDKEERERERKREREGKDMQLVGSSPAVKSGNANLCRLR